MENGLNVGVIGYGVVGSVTAKRLYQLGNRVYVHDTRPPMELAGWDDRLHFRENYGLQETNATFLVLPTPSREERLYRALTEDERMHTIEGRFGESLDMSITESVIGNLAQKLGTELRRSDDYHLFVVRSTVEPGTTRKLGRIISQISGKQLGKFGMAMIPEFLRAYNNEADEENAPLIVMGYSDEKALDLLNRIYQKVPPNEQGESRLLPMGLEEAELVKLECNSLNALRISMHNARALFYESLRKQLGIGIDYERMTNVLTTVCESFTNPRYGSSAGIFYGGTCLRKDPNALHTWATKSGIHGYFVDLLVTAILTNTHLQTLILNDHKFLNGIDQTGIPARLKQRDHSTYENVRKVVNALAEAAEPKHGMLQLVPRQSQANLTPADESPMADESPRPVGIERRKQKSGGHGQ